MIRFLPAIIAGKKFVQLRAIRGNKNFKYLWLVFILIKEDNHYV